MVLEREKKYLIAENGIDYSTEDFIMNFGYPSDVKEIILAIGNPIEQGYLEPHIGIDVADCIGSPDQFIPFEYRLNSYKGKCYFTRKSMGGLDRNEHDEKIERDVFQKYWYFTKGKRISKTRMEIPFDCHFVEIDCYRDRDLIVAEIEFDKKCGVPKLGKDITDNRLYRNHALAR